MALLSWQGHVISTSSSVLILFLFQFHLARAQPSNSTAPAVPAVIAFGDSIVDPGNNNVLLTIVKSNFPPYGRDFAGHVPTGRFSNGKISADFLASMLGVKELLPAYHGTNLGLEDLATGVSFASAGTGYDPLTSAVALVTPMWKQLEFFKEYKRTLTGNLGEKKLTRLLSGSLFIVCAGSNDVVEYFSNPMQQLSHGISSYAEFLIQSASRFLQDLVGLGARKVGVVGIPPVGCMPSQRLVGGGLSGDCAADRNQLAQTYNAKLNVELQRLNSNLQGSKLFYVDVYSIMLDFIQCPWKYGFEVSKLGCCGTGTVEVAELCNVLSTTCRNASEYVFWDSYHPTQRAYELLIKMLIQKYVNFIK
ncbi:hypothetical protein C4D60_Mb04t32980 [Musa balbisiana]|uniref:Uncharacterized protein n=1 Tax=Musa balbisiana TaxID=52838 RepID=A0A4V6T4T5_MUSBA|nr:hypothetical protein C4D60_Mb04t32980 [Musa balbisiana]